MSSHGALLKKNVVCFVLPAAVAAGSGGLCMLTCRRGLWLSQLSAPCEQKPLACPAATESRRDSHYQNLLTKATHLGLSCVGTYPLGNADLLK